MAAKPFYNPYIINLDNLLHCFISSILNNL